jgi:hypothetical protein
MKFIRFARLQRRSGACTTRVLGPGRFGIIGACAPQPRSHTSPSRYYSIPALTAPMARGVGASSSDAAPHQGIRMRLRIKRDVTKKPAAQSALAKLLVKNYTKGKLSVAGLGDVVVAAVASSSSCASIGTDVGGLARARTRPHSVGNKNTQNKHQELQPHAHRHAQRR